MKENESSTMYSLAIITLLVFFGILFMALKIFSVISWSWWWVTMPFWCLPAGLSIAMVVGLIIVLNKKD